MYKEKYIKYKTKYLDLKNQLGGNSNIIQEGGNMFSWFYKKSPLVITRTDADLTQIINKAFLSKSTEIKIEIGSILDSEFQALINGLTNNTRIKDLRLYIKELSPPDKYTKLGNAINQNEGLEILVIEILDKNDIMIKVPYELMEVLSTNRNLKGIIFLNIIDDDVAIKLLELFRNNNNISNALFVDNVISEKIKRGIQSFLYIYKDKKIYLSLSEIQ